MELWEILVPSVFNNGEEISVSYHNRWDDRVRAVAGGLTILKRTKGVWENPIGKVFKEKMIPVRISCSEAQIKEIIDFTIEHYDQEAVMAFRVSEHVIIKHR